MKLTGGCYCKQIRYSFEGDVMASLQCHCRECQYIAGGHPNALMVLPQGWFKFATGLPATFTRTDIVKAVTRHFCSNCGTSIASQSPFRPGAMIIKVGTLDDPSVYKPTAAIFTIDKQPFHHIPDDMPAFERRPG